MVVANFKILRTTAAQWAAFETVKIYFLEFFGIFIFWNLAYFGLF
jgi:hypothetical protein